MNYLDDLFARLGNDDLRPGLELPKGVTYKSDLTISWEARKEAKKLSEKKWILPLKERLEKEKITKQRINIINVLVPLAQKCNDNSIADYIINLVKKEKVRWIRDVALTALNSSNLEIETEKEYLFELIQNKDWQITLNALGLIKRLDASYSNRIEKNCLELLNKYKKKPHELSSICNVLSKHGTKKAIKAIKEVAKNNSKAFAVNSALRAIENIDGANELDFFIEIFQNNRNNDVKSMISQSLCKFGDERVFEILIKRVKNILSKHRKTKIIYVGEAKPELVHILEFLTQKKDKKDKRVDKLIEFINNKKVKFMDETELKWFNEKVRSTKNL